ncbi:alpha/beta hydrolase family protein [mine drainage metagenome]|uniref:Alpha/beta hydrolase family protein n=1 Tax=mine drainage metagenome TaxID=410659 RepID=A0A1J5QAW9_9ZZZZ
MRQVQRGGGDANLIALDLAACDAYAEAPQRAAQVRARCALLLGEHDRMTPPSAAQSLQQALPQPQLTLFDSGHDLMAEVPQPLAGALRELLAQTQAWDVVSFDDEKQAPSGFGQLARAW